MSDNKLLDLSFEFAVAIVNLTDGVTALKSTYLTDQLARACASVGANIHEAQYAHSKGQPTVKVVLFHPLYPVRGYGSFSPSTFFKLVLKPAGF